MRNLYAVLNVPPNADRAAIRASFRVLARQSHPDLGGNAKRMQAISEAWAILGHSDRRTAYDRERADERRTAQGLTAATATDDRVATATHARHPDTLDYGRYTGWTIEALAHHDPDYLEWLRRSPGGRVWRTRIDDALTKRTARMPVAAAPAKRRSRLWR